MKNITRKTFLKSEIILPLHLLTLYNSSSSTLSTPFPPLDRLFNTTIEVLHFYCIE